MKIRFGAAALAVLAAGAALVFPAPSQAEPVGPQLGDGCSAELSGAMTVLPDGQTYAICQEVIDSAVWASVPTPFDPSDTWWSYGPTITLHGQGMRNPNLRSGEWTAAPQDPQSACRLQQQTVVEAGVLSAPQVTEGEAGKALTVQMQPKLFYAELSGNCLWTRG